MANQVANTSISDPGPSGSGIICTIPNVFKSKQWILDTGATGHICYTLSEFQSYKRIKLVLVKLPDGSTFVSNFASCVYLSIFLSNFT